ncbi:MAG: 4-alpha-glucanotransferase [Chloroflexi bacterium]|nr:4-alpha-glucanotransferase [Chloroflexota bacterium]
MNFPRASGILLHPTSLPGRSGIGDLGSEAYRFADFLYDTKQHLWQMLPLGPTGYGNSPYQCLSVFAGNPLLISLERLAAERLLEPADLEKAPLFPDLGVDYGAVINYKIPLLKTSCEILEKRGATAIRQEFEVFCQQNASWLGEFSLFMALKEAHGLVAWNKWEEGARNRHPKSLERWRSRLSREIYCHQYQQFLFFRQWTSLKKYCNERGIKLIGDMPIFVAFDSAEVWSHQEMFYLDDEGQPIVVAGVPPDYFSKTGQLWGNPLYRWDVMAKDSYAWWTERFRVARSMVDIIRLDHFRGFEKYWEIPAEEKTAINGRWVPGPGADFFEAIRKELGELPIIAEDLGMITPEVHALREQFGLPGMKVLQFAFGTDLESDEYLPHNYPRDCVVYTGTHDNNTTVGWFREAEVTTISGEELQSERKLALEYLGTDGREINWDFIRLALMSPADRAIIPLQDLLGLGGEARMNTPATKEGNWSWRFSFNMMTDEMKNRLKKLTVQSGRDEHKQV